MVRFSLSFRLLVFAALLTAFAAPAGATHWQLPMKDFVQDVWDARGEGLPHPVVTTIIQTRDGYLWLGTFAGLARFDGVQFDSPQSDEPGVAAALSDNIRCLLETPDGALWIGTRRQGLVRMKNGQYRVFTKKKDGLASDEVRSLAVTKDGTVWVGSPSGLSALDSPGQTRTFGEKDGLRASAVLATFVDRDGKLWVGTGNFGLSWFDGTRFHAIDLGIPEKAYAQGATMGTAYRSVIAIDQEADGSLLAGTSVGLLRFPRDGPSVELLSGAVAALSVGSSGMIWAATGDGIARVNGSEVQRYGSREGLLHDTVLGVYEDSEGSTWVGTRMGLSRLRPRIIESYSQRNGLPSDVVSCVLESKDGSLWVGSRSGLCRLKNDQWTIYGVDAGLPDPYVRSLAEGPDGTMWIGTMDGVASFKDGHFNLLRGQTAPGSPYSVRAMSFDAQGRLWLGAYEGLDRLENGKITRVLARTDTCEKAGTYYLFAGQDGSLWQGGATALLQHPPEGKPQCFVDQDVLSRNDIRNISGGAAGEVWIAAIGGLSRFLNGKREWFTGGPGPFGATMYGVIDDGEGSLWCSTTKGIFQVAKDKLDQHASASAHTIYHSYGVGDGMTTSVCAGDGQPSVWRGADGRMYFTTAAGIAVVDPRRIQRNSSPPPVYVDRMVADNQTVDLRSARRLAPGTRDIELHFTALSFVAPEMMQYRYKLEGYDRDFIDSGSRRVAYYTNLPPGSYRFRVIAANHNGIWNEKGAVTDFELRPRFYQTAWFMPLVLLTLVAAAGALYRLRIAQLKGREAELQRRVDEAVRNVQVLSGMLPICASCRRVREDKGYWRQIEAYVMEHSAATFSHSVCPECWDKMRSEEPGLPEYGRS
jgi:ligand-binding sensor domain-containing protein